MTDRARACEDLAGLACMAIIVTSEASRPIAVADIIGIGCPIYLHVREDVSVINSENSIDGLVDQGFLILDNHWEVFGIICFDSMPDGLVYALLIIIVFDQNV